MNRFLFMIAFAVSRPLYWFMRETGRLDGENVDQPMSVFSPDIQPWLDLWVQICHGRPCAVLTVRRIEDAPPSPPPAP